MGRHGGKPLALHLALALAVCLTASACGGSAGAGTQEKQKGGAGGLGSIESPAGPAVTVEPADNATAVSPVTPIKVTSDGTIDSVKLTNPTGQAVAGTLGSDAHSWQSTEPLGYGKTYQVAVTAHDDKGRQGQTTSSFTTVKPGNMTLPYISPTNGGTFGVGQPIVIHFDEAIPNHAAAEKAIQITTVPAVEGRFHWFDNQNLHWRPAEYWKSGTKVTVKASVYGVNFGTDLWGQEDRSTTFTIGPSRIAIADNNTHHMKVYINGAMVRDIPVSMGKGGQVTEPNGQVVDFWTRTGPHVVMEKAPVVRMRSASFGITNPKDPNYYDENIKLAVRISSAGEYVHLADWNIWAHGNTNTSHGCINVGPTNAQWFFDTFMPGDVVDVKGTPKPLQPWDGIGDWTIPWSQW